MKKRNSIQELLKYIVLIWVVCINFNLGAQELERPIILVKPSDRTEILEKIEKEAWAKETYTGFITALNLEIDKHQTNPEDFLRGM
ncbi:MAG: hypothetical protein NWQ38_12890, partial [Cellulophaga sp.]|nr:hypothetical protein [Cellulophaga sp.]